MYTREDWGARPPTGTDDLSDNVSYLAFNEVIADINFFFCLKRPYYFTHHTEGSECFDLDSCAPVLQGIQDYHMDSNGWNDIGYK